MPLGLTDDEARARQQQFGKNELSARKRESVPKKILHIMREPMFLLLIAAAVIYFFLGEPRDATIMLVFIVAVIGIDIFQELKTDNTLSALRDLTAPHVSVIRNGAETQIASADLVPGDIMLICEGVKIPADGTVVRCSDLCVDESMLTGEAEGVWKSVDAFCFAGTLVTQGSAFVRVDKIGMQTEYGKIGARVADAPAEDTPLQKQTRGIVKTCAIIAAAFFVLVCAVTFFNTHADFTHRLTESAIAGVTLAMAMIPEEFPVILTVFLSMGAWRLAKKNSLVRRLQSVETLGAVTVLCVDKTGTITMNQMAVQNSWTPENVTDEKLDETMALACEEQAYDPMERAMLEHFKGHGMDTANLGGELIYEYAFTNQLKMMGHVWKFSDKIIIAAKGSPEKIFSLCDFSEKAQTQADEMAAGGLRVIAVATASLSNESEIPKNLSDCRLTLCGLVGLADPPRESVRADIETCRRAGVRVVMITGDNGVTAAAIARKVGIINVVTAEGVENGEAVTGDMLEKMTDDELRERVKTANIFSRVLPEHKMRIVRAFKANGEVVAMTGDGVNDAPALKYADIGIAMGKRGSEVSREAADLILMDDNFSTIVDTVSDGRRIYDNIRKAVGYVFSIHIPIALASLLAPALGFGSDALMILPLHIVLLELIIDPTCSIVLERQPAERNIMERPPRDPKASLLNSRSMAKAVIQGLAVFAASFFLYYIIASRSLDTFETARSMGLSVIFLSNLLLVLVNSSDTDSLFASARRLAKDKVMWAVVVFTLVGLGVILYSPLNTFLKLAPLSFADALTVVVLAAVAVLWYEIVKIFLRRRDRHVSDAAKAGL